MRTITKHAHTYIDAYTYITRIHMSQYLEKAKHGVTATQIKRFLEAEARRLWNGKDRKDTEAQAVIKAEAKREQSDQDNVYSNEEDAELDDEVTSKLFSKLHETPRIVDTIVVLSGSGVPNFVSVDEQISKKAMNAFKQVCIPCVCVCVCVCVCAEKDGWMDRLLSLVCMRAFWL